MSQTPYNETSYSVGNSIFPGFNNKNGVMICGYEFGYSKHDQYLENTRKAEIEKKQSKISTFYSKSKIYNSPYDLRIIKWFGFFGHPLGIDDGCSPFDKCILQTNWCDGQGAYVSDYDKFLSRENFENFLNIVEAFLPSVLIFMGAKQIHYLQTPEIKSRFSEIFGTEVSQLSIKAKPFDGRKFKIAFQNFERVSVISLPHPSGTRGLHDDYIKLFKSEINEVLEYYRKSKSV